MKSSFHTLEKIAKHDHFNKKEREEYIEKKIEEHSKKVWDNIDKMLCINFFSSEIQFLLLL